MHLPYEESHGQKIKLNKLDLIDLYWTLYIPEYTVLLNWALNFIKSYNNIGQIGKV